MAVDFSLLPSEKTHDRAAPSRRFWTIAFFVMALSGMCAVLLWWPKDMPTNTLRFWSTLILFPVGLSVVVILRCYSLYAGTQSGVEIDNTVADDYKADLFKAASLPLAVLGAAHRISADAQENSPERIKQGAVALKAHDSIAKKGEVVKARWLNVPDVQNIPGKKDDDLQRHRLATAWLFNQLLDDLLPAIQALPARIPLTARLCVANGLSSKANEALWWTCWDEKMPRPLELAPAATPPVDLMLLDRWMDQALADEDMHVMLLVAIQLNPLLAATPSAGDAEAGTALMLAPDALAHEYLLTRTCNVHRPVRGAADRPADALIHALQWGDADASGIATAWQTGFDAQHADALRETAGKLVFNPRMTNLDQTVGRTGLAAPWLALACAASSPCSESDQQMILVGCNDSVDCALLNHANAAAAARPRTQA